MSGPASIAIVLAIAIPLQLLHAYRVNDARVEAWARDHGLELTDDNRPVVARYLRRAQVARTWGGIAGVIVPSVIDLVVNGRVQVLGVGTDGTTAPLGFGTIFLGYLLGALYAEVAQARPIAGAARKASLAPRELDAYLSRRVIRAQRALTAVVALGLLAVGVVPVPASFSTPSFASLASRPRSSSRSAPAWRRSSAGSCAAHSRSPARRWSQPTMPSARSRSAVW